jgi:hypothetical protein
LKKGRIALAVEDTDRYNRDKIFSSIKRMFGGEYVSSRKYPNMVKEMMLKASL